MLYAIFSDIHGNYPALRAALSDAKSCGAVYYIFLGDYHRDFPWANEVAETIRGLDHAVAIQGNNEGYLTAMAAQDQSRWTFDQVRPLYDSFRGLTRQNLEYLTSLPETYVLHSGGHVFHLAHNSGIFIRSPKLTPFSSSGCRGLFETGRLTRADLSGVAREAVLACPGALADIAAAPDGIHLFGHNHIQFHMEWKGKLFVNPGSCGVALDDDNSAAYSLLETGAAGVRVHERRVAYDTRAVEDAIRASALARDVPVWRDVLLYQLREARDYFGPFVRHVAKTGRERGETAYPFSNAVFRAAAETWDPRSIS